MLVGQPPFQSTSQSEIYRRARSVEYAWPKVGKHANDIPEEAKDLVCQLLKVDADERPDPDQVIGHPFFAMHGGNAMPLVMEECFRYETPRYLDLHHLPRGDVMLKGTERLDLRILARNCGVGHLAGDVMPHPAVGGDIDISLYGLCQEEEDCGEGPVVPLPKDMVYTSKFAFTSQKPCENNDAVTSDPNLKEQNASSSRIPAVSHTRLQAPGSLRMAPVQSHAATLRAAHFPPKQSQPPLALEPVVPNKVRTRSQDTVPGSVRGRRGLLNDLPVRPTPNGPDAAGMEAKTMARNPRATRAKKVHVVDSQVMPETESQMTARSATKHQNIGKVCSDPDAKRRDLSALTRARIATNVQNELAEVPANGRKDLADVTDEKAPAPYNNAKPVNALIGPDEVLECLPETKPDEILRQLQKLRDELEASLNTIGQSSNLSSARNAIEKSKDIEHRPVVVKWVDYTNKFGIGYILQNGTVGCVFKGDETSFPTCVIVANAESHLLKRKNPAYTDKHQIVPKKGPMIEFVENCDEDGLKRVLVQPTQYQVNVSPSGLPQRLSPGTDVHDFEKRRKLALWDKFGRYMTQTLGKSDDGNPQNLEEADSRRLRRNNLAGPFIKFYQRLGNTGIWGFGDGSFQFNFPDHTKIVVSNTGSWLDFYHLPIEATSMVKKGKTLGAEALSDRSVLSYPTTVMLSGHYRGHDFQDVITANELVGKLTFVRDAVGFWAREGGLGCMGGENRGFKWEGMREKEGRLVWVTVGAKGGDERYENPGKS